VRIDGTIVGVSPLKPVSLAGGAHTLAVEREGFVRHAQDFSVNEKDTTKVSVVLLPSKEFKDLYVQKAWLVRGLAIGFTVLGVASIGGGVAATLIGQSQERTLAADMNAYNAGSVREQAQYDTLRSRAGSLQTFDALSIAGFALGGVLTAVGVTLFIVGDAPGKYETQPTTSVKMGVGSMTLTF
jgi:TctA family transporter